MQRASEGRGLNRTYLGAHTDTQCERVRAPRRGNFPLAFANVSLFKFLRTYTGIYAANIHAGDGTAVGKLKGVSRRGNGSQGNSKEVTELLNFRI